MGSYSIEWKQSAKKELRRIPARARRRIAAAVEHLTEDPHPQGSRKLRGATHTYRLRVGDYRVIYTVVAAVLVIEILRVADRKNAYR